MSADSTFAAFIYGVEIDCDKGRADDALEYLSLHEDDGVQIVDVGWWNHERCAIATIVISVSSRDGMILTVPTGIAFESEKRRLAEFMEKYELVAKGDVGWHLVCYYGD